jgi:hypothetical protein
VSYPEEHHYPHHCENIKSHKEEASVGEKPNWGLPNMQEAAGMSTYLLGTTVA